MTSPRLPRLTNPGRWGDLAERVGSALIILVAGAGLLVLPVVVTSVGLSVLVAMLMWELTRLVVPAPRMRQVVGVGLVSGLAMAATLFAGSWGALAFILLAALMLGGLGILAGILAQKFDQMAAISNFVITPLSFLSGTFYSVQALPEPFRTLSHWNPVFYLIDGARYGVTGVSDAPVGRGLVICTVFVGLILWLAWRWLKSGYRMKA